MIRFSAFLVVVAVGLLVAGVVTSKLLLVYIAIGVSGVALLALGAGAAVNWRELTGKPKTAAAETSAQGPAPAQQVPAQQVPAQQGVPASQAQPGLQGPPWAAPSGPSRADYLPTDQPLRAQPVGPQPAAAQASAFQPATAQAPAAAAAWGSGVASPGGSPESRSAAQPSGSRPADAQRPAAAFTARPEAPAPSIWEWRDDSVPAPALVIPNAPTEKPVPPRGEDAAEPPSAAERQPPPETPASAGDQSPVKDQPSAEEEPPEKPEKEHSAARLS
ncbi:MAG: hypothetical protein ACRDOE_06915 [Streptosporangiaceae bacterium]